MSETEAGTIAVDGRARGDATQSASASDSQRLLDRVVLITGGGTGIGEASAIACAGEGARVVVAGRRAELLEDVVQTITNRGGRAVFTTGDVGREEDAQHIVESALTAYGRVDVLVNCAGQELVANALDTSAEWWDRVMDTNLRGVFLLSRAALPSMLEQRRGVIVNVASQLAFVGARNFVAYTASKGGVINLTRSMALDHATDGIRVNALCPGAVDTPLLRRQFADREGPQGTMEDLAALHPMGRIGHPDELGRATVFLASDDSSFMTGATLVVDGGYTAQ